MPPHAPSVPIAPTLAEASPPTAPLTAPRRRRLDGDLAAARQVQRAFLPPLEQRWNGVDVAAEYRPAYEVGGDFFEVNVRDDGRLSFVVGDVAGKGVTAALIMARVSGEARRFAAEGRKPSRVLAGMNRWLDRQGLSDRFVTATAVELDLHQRTWTVASAGHPAALLFRRDGRVIPLAERGGPGLGFGGVTAWRCPDERAAVEPDDLLLLSTDGFADCVSAADLADIITSTDRPAPLADLRQRLFARMAAQLHPDDATLLLVRVTPAALG